MKSSINVLHQLLKQTKTKNYKYYSIYAKSNTSSKKFICKFKNFFL